jgi:hypothetical protein
LNRNEKYGVAIIVLLVVIISLVAVYDISSRQTNDQTGTNSFISEPVVDIILPSLFRETSTGGQNEPLNVTVGQTDTLAIRVYPNVNLNLTMVFKYYLLTSSFTSSVSNNSSQSILANFVPSNLNIKAGKMGNTSMTLQVSRTASVGQYAAVISALNLDNSSEVWGVLVQINVI